MNTKIIDSLGYLGAIVATSLGTFSTSLDFAAKWIGVVGGITLAILAIFHKIIQIHNENLKKSSLKREIDNANKENLLRMSAQIETKLKEKNEAS